jgi:hypothetical protein
MLDITRTTRAAALALGVLLAAQTAVAGTSLRIADAPLRVPQVAVQGTGLLQLFQSVSQTIVPATDQIDFQLMKSSSSPNASFAFDLELRANPGGRVSGIYNGYETQPTLMQVFPATSTADWFALIRFGSAPVRAIVNVFDETATLVSTTTYLGADRNGVGFYVAGPAGPLYSQDARNPGERAQLLFFRGTGTDNGSAWFAAEDQPLDSGSDADYDDVVLWVEELSEFCRDCLTPVQRASWGELKSRFH